MRWVRGKGRERQMRQTGLGRTSARLVGNKGNRFYAAVPSENKKKKGWKKPKTRTLPIILL